MKKILISVYFLSLCFLLNAQNFEWIKKANGSGGGFSSGINAVTSDKNGNYYAIGEFNEINHIENDTLRLIGNGSGGPTDVFMIKFNNEGKLQWLKRFGGQWYDSALDIALDSEGNIYAAMRFQFNLVMEDTSFANMSQISNSLNIFKFNPEGKFIKVIKPNVPLSNYDVKFFDILNNRLYVAHGNVFSKFTLDGVLIKSHNSSLFPADMQINQKGTVSLGFHAEFSKFTFDTISYPFTGSRMAIGIQLDSNLKIIKSFNYKDPAAIINQIKTVASDSAGNFFMGIDCQTGAFAFFNKDTIYNPFQNARLSTILKYDKTGNPEWAFNHYVDELFKIRIDHKENILAYGAYGTGYTSIGGIYIPPSFNGNGFISKISNDGNIMYAKGFGMDGGTDYLKDIAIAPQQKMIGGGFSGGPNARWGCFNLDGNYGFVATQISDELPPLPTATISHQRENDKVFFSATISDANSYSWNFGDNASSKELNATHTYKSPGSYRACLTVSNPCGSRSVCDTILMEGIQRVEPNHVSNKGFYRLKIFGGYPSAGGSIIFQKGDQKIIPDTLIKGSNYILANVLFDNIPVGSYDLVYKDGNFSDTLKNALQVEMPSGTMPTISFGSRSAVLVNRFFKHDIIIRNNTNQSFFGLPVVIELNSDADIYITNTFINDSLTKDILDSLGNRHFFISKLKNDYADSVKAGAFMIPFLNPGESYVFNLYVKTLRLGKYDFHVSLGNPIYSEKEFEDLGIRSSCNFLPQCFQCLHDLLGFFPVSGCVSGLFNVSCSIGNLLRKSSSGGLVDLGVSAVSGIIACGGEKALEEIATNSINQSRSLFAGGTLTGNQINDGLGAFGSCIGFDKLGSGTSCFSGTNGWTTFPSAASLDPNIKSGPAGSNDLHCVSGYTSMAYRIDFENDKSATAPASEVLIIDTLDISRLNPETFRFKSFGYADSVWSVDAEADKFTREMDIRPAKNAILRVEGDFNKKKGILKWKWTTLDSKTRELTDEINDGFLNPNLNGTDGTGFVSFEIMPYSSIKHGETIRNKADIIFDANPPIRTPTYSNTIDKNPPESAVQQNVEFINDSTFIIRWKGTDDLAGLNNYFVWLTVNDTLTIPIAFFTRNDSLVFKGQIGYTYKFFSQAIDYVGNKEAIPAAADIIVKPIITSVGLPVHLGKITLSPNPCQEKVFVSMDFASNGSINLSDISGRKIHSQKISGKYNMVDMTEFPVGIYFISIVNSENTETFKVIKGQ